MVLDRQATGSMHNETIILLLKSISDYCMVFACDLYGHCTQLLLEEGRSPYRSICIRIFYKSTNDMIMCILPVRQRFTRIINHCFVLRTVGVLALYL